MQNQTTTLQDALDTRFFAPLRRPRTRRVGVELEFPVWNRTPGKGTDFAAVHAATDDFLASFPFSDQVHDDEGNIYRATDPGTGDELSFDCSYNTLEISFGPDENLNETHRRFTAYYGSPRFHDHPEFGLFSCASQTQVDADEEVELRSLMIRRDWPSFIDRKALSVQLHRILDVAEEGLARRGFGEEPLLAPLRRRADTLTSPAREHLARLERGESIESIALDYGSAEEGRHA